MKSIDLKALHLVRHNIDLFDSDDIKDMMGINNLKPFDEIDIDEISEQKTRDLFIDLLEKL